MSYGKYSPKVLKRTQKKGYTPGLAPELFPKPTPLEESFMRTVQLIILNVGSENCNCKICQLAKKLKQEFLTMLERG